MELWLIRHALPIRIDGGDAPADPGLAEEGLEQARQLADWWAPHGADIVYASPMRRAQETALPLAAALGVDITTVPDLKEFDSHLSTYIPIEELRADPVAWQAAVEEWLSPEAEEQRQAFRAGVVAAIDQIATDHPGERVAVVCHGGVINAYLSSVISLPGTMFFEPAYTSVSRVISGATHRQLVSLNETPHLGRLVVPATAG
ncbi:histidine phosphatase family protein [Aquihabitans sp. G128]|uniref:histidine phosphatase family protein n=1 Tax=Aquihabitans sp. G128 TaxID=2849779 RepID=UPI001C236C8D|nr:histidine phosphatase family protein [Aquihabitans sp. G128]QXC62080.1 histidine phosphatase family protein [Aquihabitans sp. G128]